MSRRVPHWRNKFVIIWVANFTDMRVVGCREGSLSKSILLLLLNDILFVLVPVILRIMILLLSIIVVKRDLSYFRRGLRGRLDGRVVFLTFPSSFVTFLLWLCLRLGTR